MTTKEQEGPCWGDVVIAIDRIRLSELHRTKHQKRSNFTVRKLLLNKCGISSVQRASVAGYINSGDRALVQVCHLWGKALNIINPARTLSDNIYLSSRGREISSMTVILIRCSFQLSYENSVRVDTAPKKAGTATLLTTCPPH